MTFGRIIQKTLE